MSASRALVQIAFAGVKRAKAVFRSTGATPMAANWSDRAALCASCPLSMTQCGKLYCGKPFLRQIERIEHEQGCGCPVKLKAQDPAEHCPRTGRFEPSSKTDPATCDCVWCVAARAQARLREAA